MAKTPSTMLPLKTAMPEFSLVAPDGRTCKNSDYLGKPVLVMFLSVHCPFVKHIKNCLHTLGQKYQTAPIAILGICSNDLQTHPEDGPEFMAQENYPFPFLFDSTQQVAKSFAAACTPDFFLFDRDHRLVYRGQLDSSRPGNNTPVTGIDLEQAIIATLENRPVSENQKASLGCNIKWKPGNEPRYASNH